MTKKKHKRIPELWVVFDTNSIYTGSASYFLRKEVVDLITENSAHPDLAIKWILPEVVRHERQYQMSRQATGFLPTVQKLERLLGHNLNIAPDILELRVREAVQRSIDTLGLQIEVLDASNVDWQRIILDATYRRPPFDSGESEKGFRDAIVLETFAQLIARAPQNPKSCRLALVTADDLLSTAAAVRTDAATNVRLFATVEELRGLINTLVSEVDEQFVKELMPAADKLFFIAKEQQTLYYEAKISASINERLAGDLGVLPAGADRYVVTGYTIATPQFVKKDRQHVHWSSRVDVKLNATKSVPLAVATTTFDPNSLIAPKNLTFLSEPISPSKVTIQGGSDWVSNLWKAYPSKVTISPDLFSPPAAPQIVSSGRAAYDVNWSTTLNTARKLTRPQIDSIQFVEVRWGTE